jgi:uncharacterized protein (DUF736 family)
MTQQTHDRRPKTFLAAAGAALLACAPTAYAGSCESAAKVATDLWAKYDDKAKDLACKGATAAQTAVNPGTIPQSARKYQACLEDVNKAEQIVRDLVSRWNQHVGNSWARLGPRPLEPGSTQTGTLRATGQRMFISAGPVNGAVDLNLEKLKYRGRTEVTVCTFPPDQGANPANGPSEKLWDFTIAKGGQNLGDSWSKTLFDVRGKILSVHLHMTQPVKALKYRLNTRARDSHAVVIASADVSGGTEYRIHGGGDLQQYAGQLGDFEVTAQANDRVSGKTATGYVDAGDDGYLVAGRVPDVELDDPSGAEVYINGRRAGGGNTHTVVIDGGAKSGATGYTVSGGGQLTQLSGNVDGHDATIQANDKVSGTTARGRVAGGVDAFEVRGKAPQVTLKDPNAAAVFIDGTRRSN